MNDQFPGNNFGEAPRKGMSGFMKFIVFMLVIGVVGLAICCGGGYYFVSKNFNALTDPAQIMAKTQSMVDIEIPERLVPNSAVTIGIIGNLEVVMFQAEDESSLLLASLEVPQALQESDFQTEFLKGMQKEDEYVVNEMATTKYLVDGVEREFKNKSVSRSADQKAFRIVDGHFPGKKNPIFFSYQVPAELYREEEVVAILGSVKSGGQHADHGNHDPDHGAGSHDHDHDVEANPGVEPSAPEAAAGTEVDAVEAARAAAARAATIEAENAID